MSDSKEVYVCNRRLFMIGWRAVCMCDSFTGVRPRASGDAALSGLSVAWCEVCPDVYHGDTYRYDWVIIGPGDVVNES